MAARLGGEGRVSSTATKEHEMAHAEERYAIIRHISSLYQDIADTGELTDQEIDANSQIGDEFAECIVDSLSMEIVSRDGDTITIRVKTLDETFPWLETYMAKPLVEDQNP